MVQKSVALVFGLSVALAAQDAASDKDKKALQGKWKVVSVTLGGETKLPPAGGTYLKYVLFEGEMMNSTTGDKVLQSSTFTLAADKSPKWLDMGSDIKRDRGPRLMIYELKGDDLKICFVDVGGAERPAEFSSTEKNLQVIIVLKRFK